MVPDQPVSGETYETQNESVQMRDKITSLERMMAIMIDQNNTLLQNANRSNVPVGDLLSSEQSAAPSSTPGTSKGKGRGKGRTRAQPSVSPPAPPPRQQSLLGKLNPFSQGYDPDYEPSPDEDEDESQSVASRDHSTRSAVHPPPIPETQNYQAGQTARYITSLKLEINRFVFFTHFLLIFCSFYIVWTNSVYREIFLYRGDSLNFSYDNLAKLDNMFIIWRLIFYYFISVCQLTSWNHLKLNLMP